MNRRIHLMALLLSFVTAAFAQSVDEQKKLINSIKKNPAYLYAEITTNDAQQAKDLAEDMLHQEINKYVAEQKKLRNASNIVTRNTQSLWGNIQLPRGNCFRAFLYVKKSDIIPADNVTVMMKVESDTPAQELKTVAQTTTPPAASSKRQETISKLLSISKFSELATVLPQLKREGRISEYAKNKDLASPEEYVLIIYNKEGNVEAVLSEGPARTNLKTRQPDSIDNYKGRGAFGVKVAD